MAFITTDDGREVCAWCGEGKWLTYNGDCESCMAMPAEPNGPEYAHHAVADARADCDDGEAGVACPVCEGDIAGCGWECGYASELDMLDDIYNRIEARAEAQGAL